MNVLTCAEVQEQLDLLAADACDPPQRAALQQHLHDCPTCAAHYADSRRLLGLLELHWSDAAVSRLHRRIEAEARPRPRLRLLRSFVHPAALAAALLLVAVGLSRWLPHEEPAAPQFALLVYPGKQPGGVERHIPAPAAGKTLEVVPALALGTRTGEALKRELLQAQRDGKLPPPPAVALDLALVNDSERPVAVRLGDVALEVRGAGVLRLSAPGAEAPEFLRPRSLRLTPGQRFVIAIDRLIAGAPGALEYVYLTEPGEYTVIARLHLTVDGQPMAVTGTPVRIRVGAE